MAIEPAVKRSVRRVIGAIDQFAAEQGWAKDNYHVFVHISPDWGQLHVILAARSFPGTDLKDRQRTVGAALENRFRFITHFQSIFVTLRTFAELEEGGIYGLGPEFVDADELLGSESTV